MKTITFIYENKKYNYLLEENYRDAFNMEDFEKKYTDYFNNYDYILGDYASDSLRLKGFNLKNNKYFNKINDYSKINEYIDKYCNYGCKYFILKSCK